MKKLSIAILMLANISSGYAACTGDTKITKLFERSGGWVHIKAENTSNMDINGCGATGQIGLMLNYNDTNGTEKGKDMMMKKLQMSLALGTTVNLCSSSCDTQFTNFSSLDEIN